MINKTLKQIIDSYMQQVPEVKEYCRRCLNTERWDGNVIVMVVDASFTSIGLNYFQTVVPNVERFRKKFIYNQKIKTFYDLSLTSYEELKEVWKNRRSWSMAKDISAYLAGLAKQINKSDKETFRYWAENSKLVNWGKNPVGNIKGVGINTYQYLRMMGGIDTVMPDKVVKRVINGILKDAGEEIPKNDIEFILRVETIGKLYGYRPIELCWMTWLIQSESNLSRMQKYSSILSKI